MWEKRWVSKDAPMAGQMVAMTADLMGGQMVEWRVAPMVATMVAMWAASRVDSKAAPRVESKAAP